MHGWYVILGLLLNTGRPLIMHAFIKPAVSLMNNLRYKRKLTLIGLVAFSVILLLIAEIGYIRITDIKESSMSLRGLTYLNPLVTLMENVQDYRQEKYNIETGAPFQPGKLIEKKNDIQKEIAKIDTNSQDSHVNELQNSAAWSQFKSNWSTIISDPTLKADQSPYNDIVSNLLDLIVNTCDNFTLTFDVFAESYYLMNSICTKIPPLTEELAQLKLLGGEALATKNFSGLEKENLWINKSLANDQNKIAITNNTKKVLQLHPELDPILAPLLTEITSGVEKTNQMLDDSLLSNKFDITPQAYTNQVSQIINSTFDFERTVIHSLNSIYQAQIHRATVSLYISLLIAAIGLFLLIYLFIGMYVSTTREVSKLVAGSQRIAKGDLSTKLELETKDELAQIALSFNEMRDTLEKFIQETQHIVSIAAKGDLSQHISLENKEGFSKKLTLTINQMTDTYQSIINEILRVMQALSKGDLTVKIEQEYEGTFADLKNFVNTTTRSLQNLISDIKNSTATIEQAASAVATGSIDLSKRTEQQATFIEETSASIEELTKTVKQNADNAKQANELAQSASDVAFKGGEIIDKVITTMNTINEGAKKVSDIITVIDGIAFQTNILALNAAVEAARAGEQGRGFAVVAMEVRNLAQRASSAAKEIKDLITSSVESVANGTKLVDQAGQTMGSIVSEFKQVTEIMAEIATASVEQSTGIEQVNAAMNQMDQVTEKNMMLVEKEAHAAESMEEQIKRMEELIKVFKLDTTTDVESANNSANTKIIPVCATQIDTNSSKEAKDTWDKF